MNIITRLVTPKNGDKIDEKGFRALIGRQKRHGLDVEIAGRIGDSSSLTERDFDALVDIAMSAADGAIKVYACAAGNDLKKVERKVASALKRGADGVTAVLPYYVKGDVGIVADFYGALSRNLTENSTEFILDVSDKTVKYDAERMRARKVALAGDEWFCSYCTDESMFFLPYGKGCFSVAANIDPLAVKKTCAAILFSKDSAKSRYRSLLPLLRVCDGGSRAIKTVLAQKGLI